MFKISIPTLILCLSFFNGPLSYGMDHIGDNPPHRFPLPGENNTPRERNLESKPVSFSNLQGQPLKDLPLMISVSLAPFAALFSNRSLKFARGSVLCNGVVLAAQFFSNTANPFLNMAPVLTTSFSLYFSYLYLYLYKINYLEDSNKNHLKKTTDWMGLEERFPKMKSTTEPLGLKYLRRGNIGFSLVTPLFLVCIAQYGASLEREAMLKE